MYNLRKVIMLTVTRRISASASPKLNTRILGKYHGYTIQYMS